MSFGSLFWYYVSPSHPLPFIHSLITHNRTDGVPLPPPAPRHYGTKLRVFVCLAIYCPLWGANDRIPARKSWRPESFPPDFWREAQCLGTAGLKIFLWLMPLLRVMVPLIFFFIGGLHCKSRFLSRVEFLGSSPEEFESRRIEVIDETKRKIGDDLEMCSRPSSGCWWPCCRSRGLQLPYSCAIVRNLELIRQWYSLVTLVIFLIINLLTWNRYSQWRSRKTD